MSSHWLQLSIIERSSLLASLKNLPFYYCLHILITNLGCTLTGELSCAVGAHWEAGPGSRVSSPYFKLQHVYVKWPPRPQVWEWVPLTPWLCGERIAKQLKSKANGLENSWKDILFQERIQLFIPWYKSYGHYGNQYGNSAGSWE